MDFHTQVFCDRVRARQADTGSSRGFYHDLVQSDSNFFASEDNHRIYPTYHIQHETNTNTSAWSHHSSSFAPVDFAQPRFSSSPAIAGVFPAMPNAVSPMHTQLLPAMSQPQQSIYVPPKPATPASNQNLPSLTHYSGPDPSSDFASLNSSPNHPIHYPPSEPRNTKFRSCVHCGITTTSAWRRVPGLNETFCNACGLYMQNNNEMRPKALIDADLENSGEGLEEDPNYNGPECSHCYTRKTSVWRRSKEGKHLCNACGVYIRLNGKERPLSLKKNVIKPRIKKELSK